MNDAITVALITVGVPGLGVSLKWLYDRAREQGRADEYRRTSEATITAKNKELDEAYDTITALRRQLRDPGSEAIP